MLLVIDANILFAAIIKDSKTAEMLLSEKLELIAPEYIFSEFNKYRAEILDKTERSSEDFDKFLSVLWTKINLIPHEEIESLLEKAKEISPDPDDVQYFALALKYDCAIWSNDSKLKQQNKVKVFTTEELLVYVE